MEIALEAHWLRVVNPAAEGCCAPHPGDTVALRRVSGEGEWWFFTSWGEPIAPAVMLNEATTYVLNYLAVPRVVAASRGFDPPTAAC
jgi:hypothetical protein